MLRSQLQCVGGDLRAIAQRVFVMCNAHAIARMSLRSARTMCRLHAVASAQGDGVGVAPGTKQRPRTRAGQLVVDDHRYTVDEHVVDADRVGVETLGTTREIVPPVDLAGGDAIVRFRVAETTP